MEKSNRSEPEETVQVKVEFQDLVVCQVQRDDLDGLQYQKLQKRENTVQKEASKLSETQKLMQLEKEKPAQKDKIQDPLQNSQENVSSHQECMELVDEKLKQKTDADLVVQHEDNISLSLEKDSSQTNRVEADATHKECDVFAEDKLLESDGSTTAPQTADDQESILLIPDQGSIQITQEDDTIHQECRRKIEAESSKPKLETNLTEKLEESSMASMEDPIQTAEEETADGVQKECDRTTENVRYLQENESGPELEESHHVCLRTWQMEEESSLPLPSRICYHRTHTQRQRLNTVLEVPDDPFEVEISVRRNRGRGARPPTMPTGIRDYMQRVRDHHIPPERRTRLEELQKRFIKLAFGILIGVILYVAMAFLIDFLESKYSSDDDSNVISTTNFSGYLNIPVTVFKPDIFVTDMEANVTTPMVDSINSMTAFDTEVSSVLNDMNVNGSNPMIDME